MLSHRQSLRLCFASFLTLIFFISLSAQKTTEVELLRTNGRVIKHIKKNLIEKSDACIESPYRTIDGSCNNTSSILRNNWGTSDIQLKREMSANYGATDPFNALNGEERPSAREVSNALGRQEESIPSAKGLSSMVFTWGQFIDHDIDLTPEGHSEYEPITLPEDEPLFTADIPFFRSDIASETGQTKAREQRNLITSWIDASNVYGSDDDRASWLRTFQDGKLKTSSGDLLPFNTIDGEYDSAIDPAAPSMAGDTDRQGNTVKTFVAGDVRAAEQPGLTSLHTLFVREHNRLCEYLLEIGYRNDEEIYQVSRKFLGALIQSITYNEFLPSLGVDMGSYSGYDSDVQPDIVNLFAAAAYRLGHTMVTEELELIDRSCNTDATISLLEGFFNPEIIREYNIDRVLNGLAYQTQQEVDLQIIDNLRNFLFGDPSTGSAFGIDLASLNIQRGRDHGLSDYNSIRAHFLGAPAQSFRDITKNPDRQNGLREVYGSVDNIDAWVGLLAEDHVIGGSIGPTLKEILKMQFGRLRDCDFFFYERDNFLSRGTKNMINEIRLSDIILMNTNLEEINEHVFFKANCVSSNYRGKTFLPQTKDNGDENNDQGGNGDNNQNHNDGSGGNGNGNNGSRGNNDGNNGGGNNDGGRNNGGNNGTGGNNDGGRNNGGRGNGQGRNLVDVDPFSGTSAFRTATISGTFFLSPNPTIDFLDVNVVIDQNMSGVLLEILDVNGQVLVSKPINDNGSGFDERIDLSSFSSGFYFVHLIDDKGELFVTEKIVLNK